MSKKPASPASTLVASATPPGVVQPATLAEVLAQMGQLYRADPLAAVRGQHFIKLFHNFVGLRLQARLTKFARTRGIRVEYEATILGSTKPKKVDVAVLDPQNGPLMLVGVRSQMSSITNNVLNYYQDIVGECLSLQDRYPMSVHGYIYLHPFSSIKEGHEQKKIDHGRYARLYAAVTDRSGSGYKALRGTFDQFAYLIVDFEKQPPELHDDLVHQAVKEVDLSITTFVDRLITTFNARTLFWDVFE